MAQHGKAAQFPIERIFGRGAIGTRSGNVVVQIFAHARNIRDDRDTMLLQMFRRTDAGEHKNLRRADGAGRENHFARGERLLNRAVAFVFDSGRAAALHRQAQRKRACFDGEVSARAHATQIRLES